MKHKYWEGDLIEELHFGDNLLEFVIFLPFHKVWQILIVFDTAILYCFHTYAIFFHTPYFLDWKLIYWIRLWSYIIYLTDFVISLLHLKLYTWRCRRIHKPRKKMHFLLDFITLLPLDFLLNKGNEWSTGFIIVTVLPTMRIYRIYTYLVQMGSKTGFNLWIFSLQKFGLLSFLGVHTWTCLWYRLACRENPWSSELCEPNWAVYLDKKFLMVENKYEWYLVSTYYVTTIISTVGFLDIQSCRDKERWLTIIIALFGFALIMAMLGEATSIQVQKFRRHAMFVNRFNLIQRDLKISKIKEETCELVVKFYYTFWEQKEAIRDSIMYRALPQPMMLEVALDIYWDALNCSLMFREVSTASKRAIASVMKTNLYMSGDVILARGGLKTTMMYIICGKINILSERDDESCVMSLTPGTLFGETNLVLSYASTVEIQAAMYSEVQILDKYSVYSLTKYYPEISQQMQLVFKEKLEKARIDIEKRRDSVATNEIILALQNFKELIRERDKKKSLPKEYVWVMEVERNEAFMTIYMDKSNKYTSIEDNLELYQMSEGTKLKFDDDVCIQTHCPWIINPNSILLKLWNYFIFIVVLGVSFAFPYYIGFKKGFPESTKPFISSVSVFYILDIYLQMFTALNFKGEIEIRLKKIMLNRIRNPYFLIDIIAAIPFELLSAISKGTFNRILHLFMLNRVLKAYRVILFFGKLQTDLRVNSAAVRICKYMLWLMLGTFWAGTLFYMAACFSYKGCLHESWFAAVIVTDELSGWDQEILRHEYEFTLSLYAAMQVISGAGNGDVVPSTLFEMGIMNVFFIFGIAFIVYLIADYAAMLILDSKTRVAFTETVLIMQKFLVSNNMSISLQKRVYGYLALQWEYREGFDTLNDISMYYDAPEQLQYTVQGATRIEGLNLIPLFQDVDQEFIKLLSDTAQTYILPPNEIVIYAGSLCREFYVLEEGFCEEISGLTGDLVRILGPMSNFCSVEMLFGLTALNNVKTVTHCKLTRISQRFMSVALSKFSDLHKDLVKAIEDIRKTDLLNKLPKIAISLTYQEEIQESKASWYVHKLKHRRNINHDYFEPFMDLGVFQFLRFLLLQRTILPYGKFLIYWEASRSFFAFCSGLVFPSLPHLKVQMEWLIYVSIFLDVTAAVDMYVRLHIGYFNEKGILVRHPWYTAKHYMAHGFILDLLGWLPLNYIFASVTSQDTKSTEFDLQGNIVRYLLCMNRILQLRRIPTLFHYKESSLLANIDVIMLLKYIPLSLMIMNIFASFFISMSITYPTSKVTTNAITKPSSWIVKYGEFFPNIRLEEEPLFIHAVAFLLATSAGVTVGYGDVTVQDGPDMFFFIITTIIGYIVYTYMTVKIASSKVSVNINLTLYQERMRHLVSFMNSELDITRELKQEIIDHFEYIWKRTRGVHASKIMNKFHIALKGDAVLYLYEATLIQVPILTGMERNFYRRLGMMLEQEYYTYGAMIVKKNDIVDTIYIIHKGEVAVTASDGTQFSILDRGCMFGNIDNCKASRSMVSITAIKHLDLLVLTTERFYELVEDFPLVQARLHNVCLQNMDYVGSRSGKRDFRPVDFQGRLSSSIIRAKGLKASFLLMFAFGSAANKFINILLMLASYISCLLISYEIAFQDHHISIQIIKYMLEIIFILRIYLGFHMEYEDETGWKVTNKGLIRRKYMNDWSGFWLDVISTIPLDVLVLLIVYSPNRWEWASYFRSIHLLRIIHIFKYYRMKFDYLNINLLKVKLSSILIYFTLLVHFSACIWYWIGKSDPTESSWVFDYKKPYSLQGVYCNSTYCCSVYVIVTSLTGVGISISPRILPEIMFTIIIMITCKFATSIFIGDVAAMVANYSYTLVNMNYENTILKDYVKDNHVSNPLIKKIISYVTLLWEKEKGNQMPDFLHIAPRYLIEELKVAAYGKHVYETVIFKNCHEDFLRQLTVYLNRVIFFPGNFIINLGDVDNTMYFIHKGVVDVITQDGSTEYLHDILNERDIFGIVQGLHEGQPHTHTFKAITVVTVVTLKLTDWEHLLDYFPAARTEIYRQLEILKFK